jgi:hypothetical protein
MNATTTATATEPSAEAALRIQARELLGIAPDATTAQQLQATLEFIDGCDGDVSSAQFDAIELLHGIATEHDLISGTRLADFRDELEVHLGEEIEQFAGQFFDIPPQARSSAWARLYPKSEISIALRRRLEGMLPGLHVEPPQLETIADPRQSKLLRTQLALFRLRPTARGPLLIAARQEMSKSPREWSTAVGRFAKTYPDVAKLVPEFVDLRDCLIFEAQAAVELEKKQKSWARYKRRARFWAKYSVPAGIVVGLIYMFTPTFLLILSGWPEPSGNSQHSTLSNPWVGPSDPASLWDRKSLPPNIEGPVTDSDLSLSPGEAKRVHEMPARIRQAQDRKERSNASEPETASEPPAVEGDDPDNLDMRLVPPDELQIDWEKADDAFPALRGKWKSRR